MLDSSDNSAYDRSAKAESASKAIEERPMQTAVGLDVVGDGGLG
jgi:hypothetical protein